MQTGIKILTEPQHEPGLDGQRGLQRAGKRCELEPEWRYDPPAAVPCTNTPFPKTILNRIRLDMAWTEAAQSSLSPGRLNRDWHLGEDLASAKVAQMLHNDLSWEGGKKVTVYRTIYRERGQTVTAHSSYRDRKVCVIGKDTKQKVKTLSQMAREIKTT